MFGLCSLEIRDIQSGDAGVYTARACNTTGEETSTAKLLVYGKDSVYILPLLVSKLNRVVVRALGMG